MSASVELVLLKCVRCGTPVPAEEDEVAWVCANCGQGQQLTADGLAPLAVEFAAPRAGARVARWLPFWVFAGSVTFQQRESYGGHSRPDDLWAAPRRLFVPAFNCDLSRLETLGAALTRRQVTPARGPAAPLAGCTLLPGDAHAAAEFVVLTIEAERKDKLRAIAFSLNLAAPELWVLPFAEGEPDVRNICV
jgi:hypothetical protein